MKDFGSWNELKKIEVEQNDPNKFPKEGKLTGTPKLRHCF